MMPCNQASAASREDRYQAVPALPHPGKAPARHGRADQMGRTPLGPRPAQISNMEACEARPRGMAAQINMSRTRLFRARLEVRKRASALGPLAALSYNSRIVPER
jgi:hypothetical protein